MAAESRLVKKDIACPVGLLVRYKDPLRSRIKEEDLALRSTPLSSAA